MSSLTRLVQERKRRIQLMGDMAKSSCQKWFPKKQFLAIYMFNNGVRKRVADEYYQILLDMGFVEEKRDGNMMLLKVVNGEPKDKTEETQK